MDKDHTLKWKIHNEHTPGPHFNRMPKEIQRFEYGFYWFTFLVVLTTYVPGQNKSSGKNTFNFGSRKSEGFLGTKCFYYESFLVYNETIEDIISLRKRKKRQRKKSSIKNSQFSI